MAIPITIPRLGWSMEEGTFGGWLKKDGDEIRPGDRLFVLETEKAAEEVETLDGGILRIDPKGVQVGDVVAVGKLIGFLAESGEIVDFHITDSPAKQERVVSAAAASTKLEPAKSGPAVTPRARRMADELGVDWATIRGTGRGGRIRERDVPAASLSSRPLTDPCSRDAESSERSAERGSVGARAFSTSTAPPRAPLRKASASRLHADSETGRANFVRLTPMRRTIAARMVESQRATAPVTLTTTVDATNLVRVRDQHKSSTIVPSYTDLIVKLSAIALQQHPLLAAQWTDEGIRLPDAIHIGIAVDSDAGLRVPVIRDVVNLGIDKLASQSRDLIERARAGKLAAAEMQGGCFTVSNLGSYGIDAFTPIINYPECSVLGIGRIARRPAVVGDAIVPRDQVTLSLTFDHRIVDGAPAARFLQTLATAIENPGDLR